MKKFKVTYFVEGSFQKIIEAKNEEEAIEKMDAFFDQLSVPELDLSAVVESDIEEIK